MIKTLLYRRLQSKLWDEESLNKIDMAIEQSVNPVAEADKQASQLIANTTRHRRWDTIVTSIIVILLLVLIIPGGMWVYSKFPPNVSDATAIPPTETVIEGEETPTPTSTNSLAVVTSVETITAEPRPNLQVLIDKSNIPEELRLGDSFDLIFQVSNRGSTSVDNVFVYYNLPDSLEVVATSGQGNCTEQERSVRCQVGLISAGVHGTSVRSNVKVIDDQSDIELTAENYWVTADTIEDIYGIEPLHLTIVAPKPSRIELAVDPSILYISGVLTPTHQTVITATVYDQWDQKYNREGLSVEISVSPDFGSFDSSTQSIDEGTAVFHYAAADQPGAMILTATIKESSVNGSHELTIAQVTNPKPLIEQLFVTSEGGELWLTQIPTEWPVEIIGQPQNERFPVAIELWVVRELVDVETRQLLLSTIQNNETFEDQIRYAMDLNPNTYPSQPYTLWGENASLNFPRMYHNDDNVLIDIKDNSSENNYVLIRIKGWMPVNQLEIPSE